MKNLYLKIDKAEAHQQAMVMRLLADSLDAFGSRKDDIQITIIGLGIVDEVSHDKITDPWNNLVLEFSKPVMAERK